MKLSECKKKFLKDFVLKNIDDLEENKIDELLKVFFEINNNYNFPYYPYYPDTTYKTIFDYGHKTSGIDMGESCGDKTKHGIFFRDDNIT